MKTRTSFIFVSAQRRFVFIAAVLAIFAIPTVSHSQGVINGVAGGAAEGSYRGNRSAGPVGGVVGGALGAGVGGVVGGVNGVLGISPGYHRHHRRGYYRHGRYYRRY